MGSVLLDVVYDQPADRGLPGEITLNDQTIAADGRLDEIGSTVAAYGFVLDDFLVGIECTRTTVSTMTVRLILTLVDPESPYYCDVTERVVEDVPLDSP